MTSSRERGVQALPASRVDLGQATDLGRRRYWRSLRVVKMSRVSKIFSILDRELILVCGRLFSPKLCSLLRGGFNRRFILDILDTLDASSESVGSVPLHRQALSRVRASLSFRCCKTRVASSRLRTAAFQRKKSDLGSFIGSCPIEPPHGSRRFNHLHAFPGGSVDRSGVAAPICRKICHQTEEHYVCY